MTITESSDDSRCSDEVRHDDAMGGRQEFNTSQRTTPHNHPTPVHAQDTPSVSGRPTLVGLPSACAGTGETTREGKQR